jgi:hypothetical protein
MGFRRALRPSGRKRHHGLRLLEPDIRESFASALEDRRAGPGDSPPQRELHQDGQNDKADKACDENETARTRPEDDFTLAPA